MRRVVSVAMNLEAAAAILVDGCAKFLQTIPRQSRRTVVLEVAALSSQVVYHCT